MLVAVCPRGSICIVMEIGRRDGPVGNEVRKIVIKHQMQDSASIKDGRWQTRTTADNDEDRLWSVLVY